jgi:hypothetical protein
MPGEPKDGVGSRPASVIENAGADGGSTVSVTLLHRDEQQRYLCGRYAQGRGYSQLRSMSRDEGI